MSRKTPEPEAHVNHERWIVTYADMVTLLFALFVVLWAMSDVNETKLEKVRTSIDQAFSTGVLKGATGTSPIFDSETSFGPTLHQNRKEALAIIKDQLNSFRAETGVGPPSIQIRTVDENTLAISLANNLLFDSGSASLEAGSGNVLMQVAASLLGLPPSTEIRIVGHTDNVAPVATDYVDNLQLSTERALTVTRFLQDLGGVDGAQMEVVGRGEFAPVASNVTPEGRALNRRVDIVIIFHDAVSDRDLAGLDIAEAEAAPPTTQSSSQSEGE